MISRVAWVELIFFFFFSNSIYTELGGMKGFVVVVFHSLLFFVFLFLFVFGLFWFFIFIFVLFCFCFLLISWIILCLPVCFCLGLFLSH